MTYISISQTNRTLPANCVYNNKAINRPLAQLENQPEGPGEVEPIAEEQAAIARAAKHI